jgi:competence protein ComEC
MAKAYHIYIWKKAPFLRLLLPAIAGILLEFYFGFTLKAIIAGSIFFAIVFLLFHLLPEAQRFKWRALQGCAITLFLVVFGMFLTWQKDVRNNNKWYGKNYNDSSFLIVTVKEPPVEKAKSYKAISIVESVINHDSRRATKGTVLIYFAKDSLSKNIKYGDRIIIGKKLQAIKNSGNPAAFNYARYAAFQQIFHQVYLTQNEWILLKKNDANQFKSILFLSRGYILNTLSRYIPGTDESALAEALLIGYRIDLDRDLVQAYSNVGVVHLIAISGMHLALIYYFLLWLVARIPFVKKSKITRLILILGCLWFFALLTGAPASVLRSAVMFTFIAIGSSFNKNNSIYNSLAISAFVLLCYDPFMLWDVGFQLSYLAVLGIVVTQKPIYHWLYYKNKIADFFWKLASVSLAAQLFTLPVCVYYFHQFPLLFLLSNMIAIPLSTLALWGCIGIVSFSSIPLVASFVGKIVWAIIWLMNHAVLMINKIPFALWERIFISITGVILLYIIFSSLVYWLLKKSLIAFRIGLIATLIFAGLINFNKWQTYHQKKMIVYNVPMHEAIDFVQGNNYYSVSDSGLKEDNLLQNFNLKPARIALMLTSASSLSDVLIHKNNCYQFYNKRILLIDSARNYFPVEEKIKLDYIIISKNPQIKISKLAQTFDCKSYVFDASNSRWKIGQWKKECEELHLHSHSVSDQGAFVTDF